MSVVALDIATGYVIEPYAVAETSTTGGWAKAARDVLAGIGTAVRSLLPAIPSTDLELLAERSEVQATASVGAEAVVPRWQARMFERMALLFAERPERAATVVIAMAWAQGLFRVDTPAPAVSWSEDDGVEFTWHRNGWHFGIEVAPGDVTFWALEHGAPVDSVQAGSVLACRGFVAEVIEAVSQ